MHRWSGASCPRGPGHAPQRSAVAWAEDLRVRRPHRRRPGHPAGNALAQPKMVELAQLKRTVSTDRVPRPPEDRKSWPPARSLRRFASEPTSRAEAGRPSRDVDALLSPRQAPQQDLRVGNAQNSYNVDAVLTPRQRLLLRGGGAKKSSTRMLPAELPGRKRALVLAASDRSRHRNTMDADLSKAKRTLWVGGIPATAATSNAVKLVMQKLGKVLSVHVRVKDGANKSWALVMFAQPGDASRACCEQTRVKCGAGVSMGTPEATTHWRLHSDFPPPDALAPCCRQAGSASLWSRRR